MERYTTSELFHMKDKIRFREIYEGILGSAKLGHKRKEIWWQSDDNIEYLKECINWYFCCPKIEDQSDHIVVIWDSKVVESAKSS